MTLFKFPMPDIGEGVAEGEIVEWRVKEGDQVKEDDVLCEVMTDKATVEIPSPVEGKIIAVKGKEGEAVPVGTYFIHFELAEGAHVPVVARHGEHDDEDDAPPPSLSEQVADRVPTPAGSGPVPAFRRPAGERALSTPYTRKLARTLGVDVEAVRGSGEIGRVTPEDVKAFVAAAEKAATAPAEVAAAPAAAPAAATPSVVPPAPPRVLRAGGETRIAIKGLRKIIAERMHVSKSTAAHFTYVDEVDVTELVQLRRDLKSHAADKGVKLTYLPFILKAVASGLRQFPTLNGLTDDARQEFVVKHDLNFGIAVDTDAGLIVPVVKGVDQLSLLDLAREIARVAGDARVGKSKLDDLQGGSFTVTNAGNIGGLFATPVINYPEAAILGVHAIKKRPWIVDGEIAIRDVMYLSISIDHRMNDGATGARFMNHVIGLLGQPGRLFLEM